VKEGEEAESLTTNKEEADNEGEELATRTIDIVIDAGIEGTSKEIV
jgi:hypothetical protein